MPLLKRGLRSLREGKEWFKSFFLISIHSLFVMKILNFEAQLIKDDKTEGSTIVVPFNIKEIYGQARARVKGTIEGKALEATVVTYGGVYYIGITKKFRQQLGREIGAILRVSMEKNIEERALQIPDYFAAALADNPQAKIKFDKLAFTHRNEYVQWIKSAKKEETRQTRISKAIEKICNL
jgi:hypothetical protein